MDSKVSLTTGVFSPGGFPSNTKTGLMSCSRKVSVRKNTPVRGLQRRNKVNFTQIHWPKNRNPCNPCTLLNILHSVFTAVVCGGLLYFVKCFNLFCSYANEIIKIL